MATHKPLILDAGDVQRLQSADALGVTDLESEAVRLIGSGSEQRGTIEVPVSDDGVVFGFTKDDGSGHTHSPEDGGVGARAGELELHGTAVKINSWNSPGEGNRQVHCTDEGILYLQEPTEPSWEESDTDSTDYDLGSGTGQGSNVELTGLVITIPEDVADGNKIDVAANIDVVNKSATRNGTMDVGFGINGAVPSSWSNHPIGAGFDGYLPISLSTTTHGGLTTGDTISIWARRSSGSHSQFGIDLTGSTGSQHELIVSRTIGGDAYPYNLNETQFNEATNSVSVSARGLHPQLSGSAEKTLMADGNESAVARINVIDSTDDVLKIAVVSALPGSPDPNTLYFVTS